MPWPVWALPSCVANPCFCNLISRAYFAETNKSPSFSLCAGAISIALACFALFFPQLVPFHHVCQIQSALRLRSGIENGFVARLLVTTKIWDKALGFHSQVWENSGIMMTCNCFICYIQQAQQRTGNTVWLWGQPRFRCQKVEVSHFDLAFQSCASRCWTLFFSSSRFPWIIMADFDDASLLVKIRLLSFVAKSSIKAETLVLGAYVPEGWKLNCRLAEELLQKVVMMEHFQCWEWKKLRIKKSIKNWLVGGWWWLVGGGWWLVTLALFGGLLFSLRTWACSCWRRRGWPVGFVGGSGQGVRSSRDGKWWKPCWWNKIY